MQFASFYANLLVSKGRSAVLLVGQGTSKGDSVVVGLTMLRLLRMLACADLVLFADCVARLPAQNLPDCWLVESTSSCFGGLQIGNCGSQEVFATVPFDSRLNHEA